MEYSKAIEILRRHNAWRRGAEIPMDEPQVIGEAIDAVVENACKEQPAGWSEDWQEEDIRTRFAFYTCKNEEDDGVLYLSNVFVEEASRNHGFGTKILAAAEKVAETIGVITIRLKVKQDSPANAWYRKNGYGYMCYEGEYDWLEKTLEYMKPVKQGWSEEDLQHKSWILKCLADGERKMPEYAEDFRAAYNWLKSLSLQREQPEAGWLRPF